MSGIYTIGSYTALAQSGMPGSGPLYVGIGESLRDAYDSLEATPCGSHESERAAILWAATQAWPDDEPAAWHLEEVELMDRCDDDDLRKLDDDAYAWCVEHLDAPRLARDADTEHQSAEDWYGCYGGHLSTSAAGDVVVQAVEYEWLEDPDDEAVGARLIESTDHRLTQSEAEGLVAMARSVRETADALAETLDDAVSAYSEGDYRSCLRALRASLANELPYGDWPATRELADNLLVRGSSAL